ncbi:reprolysin-like metallopeptidase [Hymenobacter sedentarius]|nr:zinc-dependent metalloprotease family protein [Hymenobacter sedentarius]
MLLALGVTLGAQAQQQAPQFFHADVAARTTAATSPLAAALYRSQALTLDVDGLQAALATAPPEAQVGAVPLVIALPLPNGGTGRFALHEAPIMAPALAAHFPDIKTYAGIGLDDASASVRLDMTPQGFHGQVLTAGGNSFYIDPVSRNDARHYLGFYQRDMNRAAAGSAIACGFAPTAAELKTQAARLAVLAGAAMARSSGPQLRTYRLALACTPEYALTKGNTVAGVMAAEVTTVNRVVGVYEKELAVRMVLVPNNDKLIFLSGVGPQPPTPYSNSSGSAMLSQNQTNIDQLIGPANYDIGHVVSTGGGGWAYFGVVCSSTWKAAGVTGSPSPVGDAFDIDFVAHEMGHQFAGNHPFNGNAGNCAGGNRNPSTAWEPGSGSTIMAYAGICGSSNDLQPNSDPTFHTGNYQEMRAFIEATTCSVESPTGNTAPTITAPASGKTLPISTPFKLTASATDAENDALTYSWEELDLGSAGAPTTAQVPGDNVPLFRSFYPTASGTRYFPRLSNLVANTTAMGERLPSVTRALTFRCTARDEHNGPAGIIGGVNFSPLVSLEVSSTAGPFVVTAPNTAVFWTGGTAQTVTWDVASTTNAPVSCALVNLRLSLDGGLTYPIVLAQNEANDGSAVVIAPSPITAQTRARVMVEAADNYFFDISNADFTITPPAVGPTITSFTPTGGLGGAVVTVFGSNFTGATAVSFNGTVATSFTVNSSTQLTAMVATGTTTGPISVVGPAGTVTSAMPFVVGAPPVISGFSPTTGPVGTSVIITGSDFSGTTQVAFNGTIAPAFTVNSATQITATVPGHATTGSISVITPVSTGVSANSFTVIPAPFIASFTPTAGAGGTVVVLTGGYFTGATQITFNGTVAPAFTVNSATQITVTVPTGAATGPIAVTSAGGVGTSTAQFVVAPANDLCGNALPLACGQTLIGTTVRATATGDPTTACTTAVDGGGVFYSITGTGASFTVSTCNAGTNYDTKLFVYSGTCGAYTCVGGNDEDDNCTTGSTASTVTFNSVASTQYLVFVSGYNGDTGTFVLSATCARPTSAPTITSLSPASGPVGTLITVTGTNFTGATVLTLNGAAITGFTLVNATTITFTLPAGATTGNVVVTTPGGASAGSPFTVTTPTVTTNATTSEFSVWPNPVAGNGALQVKLAARAAKATLTLRSVVGQLVSTRTFSGSATELATAGLAAGTYLLTVQAEGRSPSIRRVVVE